MTDVVAVALISAGSSLLGATVGAVTTYKISLRSAQTTIATAEAQKEVELAKIEAENSRLREQHSEDERRNRQDTYHRTVSALQRIHGLTADSEDLKEVMQEWRYCRSGVQIFGSKEAFNAVDEVQRVIKKKPPHPNDQERSKWQEEFKDAVYPFIEAVRQDVKSEGLSSSNSGQEQ